MNRGETPYDRLGAMEAITAAVDKFYDRVLADPNLGPFFARTNLVWPRIRQTQYLAIDQSHFDRAASRLNETLRSLDVTHL